MNINNYREDKKVYISDQIKAVLIKKENGGQGFIQTSNYHEKKRP